MRLAEIGGNGADGDFALLPLDFASPGLMDGGEFGHNKARAPTGTPDDREILISPGGTMNENRCEVEVFFDGDCPLCRREIAWMKGRDRAGKVQFTNIADPHFSPSDFGLTFEDFMAEIQGRLPDGKWITGVEVFRRLYSAIGFGGVVAMTRWPLVSGVLDRAYKRFARRRLQLTGRCAANGSSCRVPSSVRVKSA